MEIVKKIVMEVYKEGGKKSEAACNFQISLEIS